MYEDTISDGTNQHCKGTPKIYEQRSGTDALETSCSKPNAKRMLQGLASYLKVVKAFDDMFVSQFVVGRKRTRSI